MSLKPEQIDHINLINWFNHQFQELKDDLHHFANERKCSVQTGRTLKRMGVKKGVLDFFLALPQNGCHGFWLELKVGNNKLTPEQVQFMNRKTQRGYLCAACWGWEAGKELLLTYLRDYDKNSSQDIPKNLLKGKPIC